MITLPQNALLLAALEVRGQPWVMGRKTLTGGRLRCRQLLKFLFLRRFGVQSGTSGPPSLIIYTWAQVSLQQVVVKAFAGHLLLFRRW
jgi:hypothetical protein